MYTALFIAAFVWPTFSLTHALEPTERVDSLRLGGERVE